MKRQADFTDRFNQETAMAGAIALHRPGYENVAVPARHPFWKIRRTSYGMDFGDYEHPSQVQRLLASLARTKVKVNAMFKRAVAAGREAHSRELMKEYDLAFFLDS